MDVRQFAVAAREDAAAVGDAADDFHAEVAEIIVEEIGAPVCERVGQSPFDADAGDGRSGLHGLAGLEEFRLIGDARHRKGRGEGLEE
jgi:hypothetical protein